MMGLKCFSLFILKILQNSAAKNLVPQVPTGTIKIDRNKKKSVLSLDVRHFTTLTFEISTDLLT